MYGQCVEAGLSLVIRAVPEGHLAVALSFRVEVGIRCVVSPEFRSCVKVEVAVLGSPSPNKPHGLCKREAAFKEDECCVLFVV